MSKTINDLKKYFCFVLISTLFLLVFGDNTSPLAKYWYSADSSLFILFGKALNDGLMPYKDVFDHKGPYLFFLEQIGQLICDGKTGAFIVQVINLSIVLFFSYKIFLQVCKENKLKRMVLYFLPILFVLAGTLEGGNTNEEFSLPFSVFSLYSLINYLYKCDNNQFKHNPVYAAIYGLFFGFIAFARINNSSFICAIVLTILIILIVHKEYKNILFNALAFIGGFLLAVVPMLYFYYANNALNDMLYSTFIFAFKYSVNTSILVRIKGYFLSISFLYIIPIFLSIIILIKNKKTSTREFLFAIISTLSTIAATFIGYNFYHYYILTIPNYVFLIYLTIKYKDNVLSLSKNKLLVGVIILCLLGQSYRAGIDFINSMVHVFDVNITYRKTNYYKYFADQTYDIIEKIPESDKNSIWSYDVGSQFYLRADAYPCINYYDFVIMYFDEKLGDMPSTITYLMNSKSPKWIVATNSDEDTPIEIYSFISENYVLYYENYEYKLYRHNQ